jgi:hypothetical protein
VEIRANQRSSGWFEAFPDPAVYFGDAFSRTRRGYRVLIV